MEYWDLYDENRNPKNKLHLRGEPVADGDYHIVVCMCVFTPDGKILITLRHPDKPNGLKWECTGGAVMAGEDSMTAVLREIKEETGLAVTEEEADFVLTVKHPHSFLDVYVCVKDVLPCELSLQEGEVIAAKLVTLDEFLAMKDDGRLVTATDYNFEKLYFRYFTNKNIHPKPKGASK